MKCLLCGKEKDKFYLGICLDCWLEDASRQLQRGSLPAEVFASGSKTSENF